MTQQKRDVRVTTGYKVDTASVKQAVDANKNVAASYMSADAAVKSLGADVLALNPQLAQLASQQQTAANATQKLAQTQTLAAASAAQNTAALRQQRTPVQDLTALYAGLEQQEKAAAAAGATVKAPSSGGGISSGFSTLRSLSGAAGLIAGNSQAGSTVAAFIGLTSVLGPVGVGAAAFAVGLRAVTDWQERATQAGKDYAAVLERISGTIAGGATTQDINQQIQQLETQQQVARESTAEIERIRGSFFSLINGVTFGTDEYNAVLKLLNADLYDATGGTAGLKNGLGQVAIGADVLGGILEQGKDKVDAATAAIAFLNVMLGSDVVAANTAAAAAAKLRDAQVDAAERAVKADQMTREEREKQIAQNENDIRILRELALSSTASYDTFLALTGQIDDLRTKTEELRSVMTSTADLYAREQQSRDNAKDTLQQLNDAYKREADARAALAEISQKMADADEDARQKSLQLAQDTDEKELTARADAAERRQEIEQQDADRRAEILKQFNRSYGDALGNRDALAAVKAKEQRDDELDKQAIANKRQLEQLDKQLDKQLRSIQTAFERQQRSIDDAYNKQLRTLQRSLDEQNANIVNAQQAQRTLQAAYNSLIYNAEVMHQAAMYKTIYDYGEMARVAVENAFRSIANTIRGSLNGVVGGPDSGTYPGASVGGNLLNGGGAPTNPGGFPTLSSTYGNSYLANRSSYSLGSGISPNLNVSGGMPARGSLPSITVNVSTPIFDKANIDKLWSGAGGIRAKLLEEMR